jgi:lysophospholipase L1-like esterase
MGYGIRDRRRTYPSVLQGLLGDGYEVGNFGNSGRGILRKSLKGWDPRGFIFMPQHEEALAFRPHLVICNLGINDLMDWDQFGGEDLADDYRALLQTYKTPAAVPRSSPGITWPRASPGDLSGATRGWRISMPRSEKWPGGKRSK